MIDLIWDLFQHRQIGELQENIRNNSENEKYQNNKIESSQCRLQDLEQRHEQLKLVTMAMWTLLKEHSGLTENDLKKYIEKVDLMDGKADGKINIKEKSICNGCKREVLTKSIACPYCGHNLRKRNAFANL